MRNVRLVLPLASMPLSLRLCSLSMSFSLCGAYVWWCAWYYSRHTAGLFHSQQQHYPAALHPPRAPSHSHPRPLITTRAQAPTRRMQSMYKSVVPHGPAWVSRNAAIE